MAMLDCIRALRCAVGNRGPSVIPAAAMERRDKVADPPIRVDAPMLVTTSRSVAVFVERP
jgi:hypothetical protein